MAPRKLQSDGRSDEAAGRLPFLGLTGGIGSGKSEALAALDRLGATTLSADAVVHELLETDEVRDRLVARFGPEVAPAGSVDRPVLARLVFERPEERAWLEREIWPLVGRRVAAWYAAAASEQPRPGAAVVEVPLLFESGMEPVFDATVAIVADESLRARRAAARGHEGVDERTARQLTQEEKAERATYVVQNDGDLTVLEERLSRLLETLGT